MKNEVLNLLALQETREKLRQGELPARKSIEVSGVWLLEDARPLQATLTFPEGSLTLEAGPSPATGGTGTAPDPVQYCAFAMMACYAVTFVTLAHERGLKIRQIRARGATEVNLEAMLGLREGPVTERVRVELEVDSNAPTEILEELRDLANRRCPAAYTVGHAVPFEARIITRSTP